MKGLSNKHASIEQQVELRRLEDDFYAKVNYVIAHKVTPIYNLYLLIVAAFFVYFIVKEENQCYARD